MSTETENKFKEKLADIKMQKEMITAIFQEGEGDPVLFDEMFNVYLNMIEWLENNNEILFTNVSNEQVIMETMNETECGNKLKKAYLDKFQRGKITFVNFLREVSSAFREGQTPLPQFGTSSLGRPQERMDDPSSRNRSIQGSQTPAPPQNQSNSGNQGRSPTSNAQSSQNPSRNQNVSEPSNRNPGRSNISIGELPGIGSNQISDMNPNRSAQGSMNPGLFSDDHSSRSQHMRDQEVIDRSRNLQPSNASRDNRSQVDHDYREPKPFELNSRLQASNQQSKSSAQYQAEPSKKSELENKQSQIPKGFAEPREKTSHVAQTSIKDIFGTGSKPIQPDIKKQEIHEDSYDYLNLPVSKNSNKKVVNFDEHYKNLNTPIIPPVEEKPREDLVKKAKEELKTRAFEAQAESQEIETLIAEQKARDLTMIQHLQAHKEAGVQSELQKKRNELALQRAKKEKEDLLREIQMLSNQSSNLETQMANMRSKIAATESKELNALKTKKKNLTDENNNLDIEISHVKREIEAMCAQMIRDGFNPGPLPFEMSNQNMGTINPDLFSSGTSNHQPRLQTQTPHLAGNLYSTYY